MLEDVLASNTVGAKQLPLPEVAIFGVFRSFTRDCLFASAVSSRTQLYSFVSFTPCIGQQGELRRISGISRMHVHTEESHLQLSGDPIRRLARRLPDRWSVSILIIK
jgi:hypothetical protein